MTTPFTFLLVEDDPGHARLIDRNIRRAGVENPIHHFSDGTSAINFLNDPKTPLSHNVMLLDLNLPDMNGSAILETIKQSPHMKHMPVLVLTTTDDDVEMKRCYDLGCNAYIIKPVEYEAFSNAIQQLGRFISVIQVP